MATDSRQVSIIFSNEVLDAILARKPASEMRDFIRAAVSEKLARDFGVDIPPVLSRANQGRRTDLERRRRTKHTLNPLPVVRKASRAVA